MIVKMDTRSILRAAFRQKYKFLGIFLPIIFLSLIYALFADPVFRSSAKLFVKFNNDIRAEISPSQNNNLNAEEKRGLIQANLNIFRSRDIVKNLLNDYDLNEVYPDIAQNDSLSASQKMDKAIIEYLTNLETFPSSDAGIINTSLYHKSPSIALELLEKHIEIFIENQTNFFTNPQTVVIREQTEKALKELEKANDALLAFKDETGVTSIDEEISILLNTRSDIAEYLTTYDGNAELGSLPLPAKRENNENSIPFPALDESQQRINELRSQEKELLLTYKPNSEIIRKIRQNIQAEVKGLRASMGELQAKLQELDERIAKMNKFKARYDVLRRDIELKESSYENALARMQAAEVNDDLNKRKITQIALIERPSVSSKPAKPNKKLIVLLAIIGGGCLGLGVSALAELLDSRLIAADQITHLYPQAPLLANFTFFSAFKRKHRAKLPVNELEFLIQEIDAQNKDKSKIISVTSSNQNEGTSTLAFNLANYLSLVNPKLRVLVIDEENMPEFETQELDPQHIMESGNIPAGFYSLMYAGFKNEILNEETIAHIRKNFDMVFITSSNLINDPFSTRINALAEMTVFVIEAEKTRAPVIEEVLKRISRNKINLIGFILNKKQYYIPKWTYNFIK